MDLRIFTEFLDRKPFRPFTVELDNGRRFTINHPENVFFCPKLRDIIATDEGQDLRFFFGPVAVSAISEVPEGGAFPATGQSTS